MFKYEIEIEKVWNEQHKIIKIFADYHKNKSVEDFFVSMLTPTTRISYRKYYKLTKNGPVRVKSATTTAAQRANLPVMAMPCADSDEHFAGLYFNGMIGCTPDNTKYYLVKVGQAIDIAKRMRNYATHNPMIYHNNQSLRIDDAKKRDEWETNCHDWIASHAYAVAQNSNEWFYVDEKTYYKMCDLFSTKDGFTMVALGMMN